MQTHIYFQRFFYMMQSIQNPKEMVMLLAKQKGVDINQIEELARKLGAK